MILCAFWKHGQLQRTPLDISSCWNKEVNSAHKKCHRWWGLNLDRKIGQGRKNFTCSIDFSSYSPFPPSLSEKLKQANVCNHWCYGIHQLFQVFQYFFISKMSSRLVSKMPAAAGVWCRVVDFYLYATSEFLQPFIIEVTASIRCSKCFFISKMSSRLDSKMPACFGCRHKWPVLGARSLTRLFVLLRKIVLRNY